MPLGGRSCGLRLHGEDFWLSGGDGGSAALLPPSSFLSSAPSWRGSLLLPWWQSRHHYGGKSRMGDLIKYPSSRCTHLYIETIIYISGVCTNCELFRLPDNNIVLRLYKPSIPKKSTARGRWIAVFTPIKFAMRYEYVFELVTHAFAR